MPLAMLVHREVSKVVGMIFVLQLAMNVPNLLYAVFLSGTVPKISIFSMLETSTLGSALRSKGRKSSRTSLDRAN